MLENTIIITIKKEENLEKIIMMLLINNLDKVDWSKILMKKKYSIRRLSVNNIFIDN